MRAVLLPTRELEGFLPNLISTMPAVFGTSSKLISGLYDSAQQTVQHAYSNNWWRQLYTKGDNKSGRGEKGAATLGAEEIENDSVVEDEREISGDEDEDRDEDDDDTIEEQRYV